MPKSFKINPVRKAVLRDMFLVLVIVFCLAWVWEFLLEDWFRENVLGIEGREDTEDAGTRWEFVFTSLGFTFLGLLFPFYLIYKSFLEIKRNEHQLNLLNKSLHEEVEKRTRELVSEKDIAEKANQEKSKFLSRMSHELRTPLNAILGFTQLLEINSNGRFSKREEKGIEHILKAGDHLLELVNEVLDLAQIESGKLKMVIEEFEFAPLIREVTTQLAPLADAHEISIDTQHFCKSSSMIRGDKMRFKQILINLLSNAIKYNKKGGTVLVSAENYDEKAVAISFEDSGIGIESEKLNEIFEPFNRLTFDKDNVEGAGIGLSITRNLVEMMGGEIKVSSQPGKGSCFTIIFPRLDTVENPVHLE